MNPEWNSTWALAACMLIACGLSAPAPAADVTGCLKIDSDVERLACYDREHGRLEPDAQRPQPQQSLKGQPPDATPRQSLLDSRWELDPNSKRGTFRFTPYKPVYFLPYFHSNNVNGQPTSPAPGHTAATPEDIDSNEAKLQFGFKTKLWENVFGGDFSDLWFGYTQSSRWQVYNSNISRPFRETNYEPELLMVFRTNYNLLGLDGRMAGVGINHQSNGRSLPLSRSWNRVVFPVAFEDKQWTFTVRPWMRIGENVTRDDNPDISDYMGRGDATLVYSFGEQEISVMARHSLRGGDRSHGAVQFDWAFPIHRQLRGHLQWFSGYGESLIDYNHRASYIGIGISLLEWYR